ncbi:hypothetical protein T06_3141 [Trichinella sp. T6]|nr:hypothetical protein T06_3141 [Trichinella sp. T6]
MRWKCEQVYNTELVLEGCGAGILILRSYEGSCEKQRDWRSGSQLRIDGGRQDGVLHCDCAVEMWARQPYTTLNALWNEWTSGIQQLMCDGLGVDGYRWPNNCSSDWLDFASRSASQL